MQQGSIVSIQIAEKSRQPMKSVPKARAVSDLGLEGDRHAEKGSARQILLMDRETLDEFRLEPGAVRENMTTQGLDLEKLQPGNVLFIGSEVTLEVTGDCEPCHRMDDIRPGLRQELEGRRGILTMVLNGGDVKVGDQVRVEP